MIIIKKNEALTTCLQKARTKGKSIGFVPTMGALHQGHTSLITASKKENHSTIASIFVNPAQFNDKKDFEKYPVTLEKDIELLAGSGCDIVFVPSVAEVYPADHKTAVHYELGYLETILEGKYRPGHFQGVCRVMDRLIKIVQPDNLYMGQKDYQQCMVVKRLLDIIQSPARLHTCPTLREADGLAMSSRNTRLSAHERENATAISFTLRYIRDHIKPGNLTVITEESLRILSEKGFRIDYVAIADAQTLQVLTHWDGKQKIAALIAAFQNEVRLIDNMLLN